MREPCVLCQQLTEIEKDTPSYMREHFIDGAGQLCEHCYEEIAQNKEWHNLL
ncbi:hypothetical protein [Effusibacillus pohliae]|uniref:hypothetical protein n=1 Tax=Effusibacillus pohliae TaxID=232270 RepID=UPI00036F3841|nr:hypothetical protein [Effusibacillus pohliae]